MVVKYLGMFLLLIGRKDKQALKNRKLLTLGLCCRKGIAVPGLDVLDRKSVV